MLACRAATTAARSRGLDAGSGRPWRGGDRDLADQPGELPAAARVLRTLAVHDVLELGMSGHRSRVSVQSSVVSWHRPTPTTHEEARVTDAPGWPGIPPRWTSSAKSGVGTALSPVSRVWFTLSHGILDEIYYPRVDQACTRDFGLHRHRRRRLLRRGEARLQLRADAAGGRRAGVPARQHPSSAAASASSSTS